VSEVKSQPTSCGANDSISYALLGLIHTMLCAVRDARLGGSYRGASHVRRPVSRLVSSNETKPLYETLAVLSSLLLPI
jgi:hypothetical protein